MHSDSNTNSYFLCMMSDERGEGALAGADEGGLRQGLFSCIFSIGTISIIIWLLLFFLLRSGMQSGTSYHESKVSRVPTVYLCFPI